MTERRPGRYNLHLLGWKSFEDLVLTITGIVLGETVIPFRAGADGGRDGFFSGQISGEFTAPSYGSGGKVVIQCKHSSTPSDGFKWSDISDEVPKIRKLVAQDEVDLFVVFSNRRLSGDDELLIRNKFQNETGVKNCRLFCEEWIESKIDGNFRLLRRVPRLYGVGDLSQILSYAISQQTRLILEEKAGEQAVFVPTPSYLDAVHAIETHGFVVLVGPPASGKSAIALNLCMVLGAERSDLEVLRLNSAAQLSDTVSGSDPHKLFWIDDFLGETTFDDKRAAPMMAAFDTCLAAIKNGNQFIFTTRDYILKDSHHHLRRTKLDFFEYKAVMVRVDNLTAAERERILYNHIKLGDLDRKAKIALKEFLPMISRLSNFTPELARRLGTKKFHANLQYDKRSLTNFVDNPVHFFLDVIDDLGESERATIAYLLLSNNSLPDPITDVPPQIKAAYGVDVADIRRSLDSLRGSLTKLSIIGNSRIWQVHHPTMIDAMHEHVRTHESMLDLFVAAAPLEVLLRDCSTVEAPNRLFVPESLYSLLISRVLAAKPVAAAKYIEGQHKSFIQRFISERPNELAGVLGGASEPLGLHWGVPILARIQTELGTPFELGQRAVEDGAEEALWGDGCSEILHHEDFENPLDDSLVMGLVRSGVERLESTLDWMEDSAKESGDSTSASEILHSITVFRSRFEAAAKRLLTEDDCADLLDRVERMFAWAERRVSGLLEEWDAATADGYDDGWRGPSSFSRSTPSIFSDVDE